MKNWLISLLLLLPALAQGEPSGAEESGNSGNWVDSAHSATADSAQALVEWMDSFFGDPNYDLEKAESYLRLELDSQWEQGDGTDQGIRLRGKVQLPRISKRLNLLFSEEDGDAIDREERREQDNVSLQVNLTDKNNARFDATMGFSSGNLKPGVRFRYEDKLGDDQKYRYVQRLQYEDGENFFTLAQLDFYRAMSEDNVLRWSNRIKYGEKTNGVEWRTRLGLSRRFYENSKRPLAVNYFATIRGDTRPKSFIKNYRLGTLLRRRVYRDFLFVELEPAVNYRKPQYDAEREVVWELTLRLEIHLAQDLSKTK